MKRFIILVAALAICFAGVPAFADSVHIGGTENITNEGGAGGAGGAGGSAAAAASSSASQSQSNTNVFVPTNVNSNRQEQGQAQGQKQGQAQGQRQSQNNKQVIAPSQTVNEGDVPYQAPAVFAPGLTSSPEACMGSVSIGGSAGFSGMGLGISVGSTWTNEQCQDRMNARTLAVVAGDRAAQEYLAASNPKMAEAMKRAGLKLATFEIEKAEKEKVAVVTPTVKEPALAALAPTLPNTDIHGALVRRLEESKTAVQGN